MGDTSILRDISIGVIEDANGNGLHYESGNGQYQLETCVALTGTGCVQCETLPVACCTNSISCIAINCHVIIFTNTGSDLVAKFDFPSIIDDITCSEDGQVIVAGDRSGDVHIIDASNGQQIASRQLRTVKQDSNERFFRTIQFGTPKQLLLLTETHTLHVLNDFELSNLGRCKYGIIETNNATWATMTATGDIITSGTDSICVWHPIDSLDVSTFKPVRVLDLHLSVKKLVTACQDLYILLLNTDGHLSIFSTDTLVNLSNLGSSHIHEFVVISSSSQARVGWATMIALLITPDGSSSFELHLCELPKGHIIYSLQLEARVYLGVPSRNAESFMFMKSCHQSLDNNSKVNQFGIHISYISETNPEIRLNRLLQKERYSDAETLAKIFGLDVQVIHQARVRQLIDCLSPWNAEEISSIKISDLTSQLLQCLEEINDTTYVIDCCLSACMPTLDGAMEVLRLASAYLTDNINCVNNFSHYKMKLAEIEHRLATFQILFGRDQYNGENWEKFLHVDLSVEFVKYLLANHMGMVTVLWNRFGDELYDKLASSENQLSTLLEIVPENVSLAELRCWLVEGLIPHLLMSVKSQQLISVLAAWIERRTLDLEVTDRPGWPANALELCNVINFDMKKSVFKDLTPQEYATRLVHLTVPRVKLQQALVTKSSDPLVRLCILTHDLQRMLDLQGRYSFQMPLEDFSAETVRSIAFRMMDRAVAVELVADTVAKTILPYASENGFDPDELLASYVEDLSVRRGIGGWHLTATWESKSVEVMKFITNKALRRHALMAVLTSARFPWEDEIEAAVEEARKLNPNDADLCEKCRMAKFKQLLIRYDLRAYNVAEAARAKDLAFYIILQDQETVMEDALEVVNFYNIDPCEIYLFRCCFLANQNRSPELICLLKKLPDSMTNDVAERFVRYVYRFASDDYYCKERHALLVAACNVLQYQLNQPSVNKYSLEHLRSQIHVLKNVDILELKFGKIISPSVCCENNNFEKVLKHCENGLVSDCISYTADKSYDGAVAKLSTANSHMLSNSTSVYIFGALLNVDRDKIKYYHALKYANTGHLIKAVDILKSMRGSSSNVNNNVMFILRVIHAACISISQNALSEQAYATTENLLADIYELMCWALSVVDSPLIGDCAQLCRSFRLAMELSHQCDTGDFSACPQPTSDPYTEWSFDDLLSDDDGGLVMDVRLALPIAFEFVIAACSKFEHSPLPYEHLSHRNIALIKPAAEKIDQLLKSNSQTRLFLGYLLEIASFADGLIPFADLKSALINTIRRVISQRTADYKLGLTCLSALPSQTVYETLTTFANSAGVQYKKAMFVAQLGLKYTNLMNDQAAHMVAQNKVAEAWWGYQLAKLHISFRDAFGRGREEKKQLLPTFARCSLLSVADVVDYCTSLNLNEDTDSMILYLKCLLIPFSNWDASDHEGCQSNIPTSLASILSRADEACRHIVKSRKLVAALQEILDKLEPYDYERIAFVLTWLDHVTRELSLSTEAVTVQKSCEEIERELKLLVYLQQYRRTSPPKETELSTSAYASERLPYHQLVADYWKVITPELNAQTVDVWVPVAALFRVQADQIYSTALRNIIQDHKLKLISVSASASLTQWNDDSVDKKLFEVVERLLNCIASVDLAVMCAGWITVELPPGAERVLASRICVSVCQRWVSSCKPTDKQRASDALCKYASLYRQIAIEQILHVNGLAEPDLLALTNSPARLIFRLYEHKSIVERIRMCGVHSSLPDIHSAVDQIAAAGQVDASKIRLTLLERWLPSRLARQQQEAADITMTGDDDINTASGSLENDNTAFEEEEIDLMRTIYVLERHSPSQDDVAVYLIRFALEGAEDVHSTPLCQVRAIRCLLALVELPLVERLSERGEWDKHLTALLYDSELRRLKVIPATSGWSFDKVDKSALARAVCRSRDQNAARVAACLAVDFCRTDDQLWAGILNRLPVSTLGIAVRSLPWRGRQISSAISSLVTTALSVESLDLSVCSDIFALMQRMPVPIESKLLYNWATRFFAFHYPARCLACGLMSSIDCSDKVQMLLKTEAANVVDEINKCEQAGHIFTLGNVIQNKLKQLTSPSCVDVSIDSMNEVNEEDTQT